jgi:hypothetical protein
MGDCLHQRAVLRQLMQKNTVSLETSWASMYHDLCADGLKLCRRPVGLRTQAKNAQRESDKFSSLRFGQGMRALRISYGGAQVLTTASKTILEVMCNVTGTSYTDADYRLPIPDAWRSGLLAKLGSLPPEASNRPWLVYRPLVARTEWRSSIQRNADPAAYAAILREIQAEGKFFVISIADLEAGKEWLVGPDAKADLSFHKGELVFEDIASLFAMSDLALTSSGFAAILAPAVGTPCISVVGGYEYPGCHDSAAKFAPYLSIGPLAPCSCWTMMCRKTCDKSIDLDAALPRVRDFLSEVCTHNGDSPYPETT